MVLYHYFWATMDELLKDYCIIENLGGHVSKYGRTANIVKNTIYKTIVDDKETLLMYCEVNTLCILSPESYEKLISYEQTKNYGKKITFHNINGYIGGKTVTYGMLYIHQIIMECYRNGKGTMNVSVDHIDRNPLNNRLENLRIATREVQEKNSKGIAPGTKRERHYNAQTLPDGLTQDMIPKYVSYMKHVYNKEKKSEREYFRIEHHPKFAKRYDGCKSNKKTWSEKLTEIKDILKNIENGILPQSQLEKSGLPQYVRMIEKEDKTWLMYERRTENKRYSVKLLISKEVDIQDEIQRLMEKVKSKVDTSESEN